MYVSAYVSVYVHTHTQCVNGGYDQTKMVIFVVILHNEHIQRIVDKKD